VGIISGSNNQEPPRTTLSSKIIICVDHDKHGLENESKDVLDAMQPVHFYIKMCETQKLEVEYDAFSGSFALENDARRPFRTIFKGSPNDGRNGNRHPGIVSLFGWNLGPTARDM
jgi:hypothetical protein